MVMVVDMKVFILSTYLTTLNTGELKVNNTVDSKDNLEEKTREVACKYDVSLRLEFSSTAVVMVVYTFNMSDNVKYM